MNRAQSGIEEHATIRKAVPGDRDAIWAVFCTSALELCATHYEPGEVLAWAGSVEPDSFGETILTRETLVAEEEGRVVAFGQFNPETSEVEALYIAPGSNNRGLGRRLLRMFEAMALEQGSGWMQISSTLSAVGFFEKEGYKQTRMEQMRLADGATLHRMRMSKSFPEKT